MTVVIAILVGLATGIVSGFGIGGGSLLMLYLTAVMEMEPFAAGGINLLYFMGCAPAAIWFHARHKQIEWNAAVCAALGGMATAVCAALIASNTTPDLLRRLFGLLLLWVGVRELIACFRKKRPEN
ncbi:MAG: TSUP family transporter [Acutalibacteraceae bacterium]